MLARGWRLTKERELCCASRMLKKKRGWGLMIFCARPTRGRGLLSLDARSGRSISPHPLRGNEQARKTYRSHSPATLLNGLFEHPAWPLFNDESFGKGHLCAQRSSVAFYCVVVGNDRAHRKPMVGER